MKKRFLLAVGVLSLVFGMASCDDDQALPSSEAGFGQIVDGVCYRLNDWDFLKKDGGKWTEAEHQLWHVMEEDSSGVHVSYPDPIIWFKNGQMVKYADLGSDSLYAAWNALNEEVKLFVAFPFRYNPDTKELTGDLPVVGEEEGDHLYVEKVTEGDLVIRWELSETYHGVDAYREYYSAYLSPDVSTYTYRIFDTDAEAVAYVKDVLEADAE